jgi:hypothetical protein
VQLTPRGLASLGQHQRRASRCWSGCGGGQPLRARQERAVRCRQARESCVSGSGARGLAVDAARDGEARSSVAGVGAGDLAEPADDPPARIAEELRGESARLARIDGAIAGTPFYAAVIPWLPRVRVAVRPHVAAHRHAIRARSN